MNAPSTSEYRPNVVRLRIIVQKPDNRRRGAPERPRALPCGPRSPRASVSHTALLSLKIRTFFDPQKVVAFQRKILYLKAKQHLTLRPVSS